MVAQQSDVANKNKRTKTYQLEAMVRSFEQRFPDYLKHRGDEERRSLIEQIERMAEIAEEIGKTNLVVIECAVKLSDALAQEGRCLDAERVGKHTGAAHQARLRSKIKRCGSKKHPLPKENASTVRDWRFTDPPDPEPPVPLPIRVFAVPPPDPHPKKEAPEDIGDTLDRYPLGPLLSLFFAQLLKRFIRAARKNFTARTT